MRIPLRKRETEKLALRSSAERVLLTGIVGEYLYSILGLLASVLALGCGIFLLINGISGSSSWTAKLLGLQSQLNDAPPGILLMVVGIFLVYATRPKVQLGGLKDQPPAESKPRKRRRTPASSGRKPRHPGAVPPLRP